MDYRQTVWLSILLVATSTTHAWELDPDQEVVKRLLIEHSDLVDPFSVQFRKLRTRTVEKTGAQIWCGDLNAKNRRGAYAGWSGFYVLKAEDGDVQQMVIDEDNPFSSILVTKLCEAE